MADSKRLGFLEREIGIQSLWARIGFRILGSFLVALLLLGAFRVLFCNFVDNYEWAYKFDARTGEITVLDSTQGYIITPPFLVRVHTIDMRPFQVTINANNRVLNAKLVQFERNKEGLLLFIAWHGRRDYKTDDYESGGFIDIMKSYAYDGAGRNYPFLRIIRELKPGNETPLTGSAQ